MPVKTDRKDARGIAQLMRLGWFRPVHCKSPPAQETRALLSARKLLQSKRHDIEMSLRGLLRGFGLRVGATTSRTFEARVRELVAGQPTLTVIAAALLAARSVLARELAGFERRLCRLAREDERTRLLMSTPGVGALVALTYVAAIDDPARFKSSRQVGAHFYEAASVILTRPVKGSALKSWALRLAARAGMRKAKVALARKLAVILHRMLADGTTFVADQAAAAS